MEYDISYRPEELIPLVTELAEKYTGFEHSSISYERAQSLMEAVMYCIQTYERSAGDRMLSAINPSADEACEAGRRIILDKAAELRRLYNQMIPDFQDYGSPYLRDIITTGIPQFLQSYDPLYAPQETLLTLDYPLLKDILSLNGIDAILTCLRCICLEQEFLHGLDHFYVSEVLQAACAGASLPPENLLSIVLPNVIGHILLAKPFDHIGFVQREYDALEDILQKAARDELENHMARLINRFAGHLCHGNLPLQEYLGLGIRDMTVRLRNCLQHHTLETLIFA